MRIGVVSCICYILVTGGAFADTYTNTFPPGAYSLIANQLDHGSNTFTELFPNNGSRDGDVILKYACTGYTMYTFDSSSPTGFFDGNFNPVAAGTLAPGEGAIYVNSQSTSEVVIFTGTPHVPVLPAILLCGFGQSNLLSRQTNDLGTYQNITGYAPQEGAELQRWNSSKSGYDTYIFSSGAWSPTNPPNLNVGESAFFIVPTPTNTGGNSSLVFQGLTNTSMGNASEAVECCISNLGSSGQDGSALYITNLGSSGQDGVSITWPGNVSGLSVHWQDLDDSNTLPVGAYLQSQAVGTTNGGANGVLGTLTVTKAGTSNYVMSANYSALGASTYTLQAYFQGVLVGQVTHQSGASLASVNEFPQGKDLGDIITPLSEEWPGQQNVMLTMGGSTGGTTVRCDQLVVTPENVTPVTATAFQIVSSQIPSLTITSENVSLVYQGLTNTSLGDASVALECCVSNLGSGGQDGSALYITNLGSSGQDGVSLTVQPRNIADGAAKGQATDRIIGGAVYWQDVDDSNTLPVGAYLQSQAVGTANGITNGVLGTLTVRKAGTGNYAISADYTAVGASNYLVQAYFQGVLVVQAANQSGASLGSVNVFPKGKDLGDRTLPLSEEWPGQQNVMLTMGGSTGGTTVRCDHLVVTPQNVTYAIDPAIFQIVASQIPSLTITSENLKLVYQGLTNTSLGGASVAVACCVSNLGSGGQDGTSLYITNLGSSGQDGLAMVIPAGVTNWAVNWAALDPGDTLPVGAYVQSQLIGTAGTVTNGVLGTTTCAKAGTSNYVISVDYSPLGSLTYTLQVYNGGTLVVQLTGQAGSVCATTKLPPGSCTINPLLNQDWPSPTEIAISGGPTVTGTEILMIPEGGKPIGSESANQVVAANMPSLTITGENAVFGYAGLQLTSVGDATLIVTNLGSEPQDGSALYITNLSSSGQDGVSFTLPGGLTGLDVQWEPFDPSNSLPMGAEVQEQVFGTAGPVTNGLLGTVSMIKQCPACFPTNYLVSADFSPIGAGTYTVKAYLGGTLVAQATNQPGASVARCSIWGDSGCIPPLQTLPPVIGGGWDWTNTTVLVSVGGGAGIPCDHLFIIPENVSGVPTALQITASQIPAIVLSGLVVSGPVITQQPANLTVVQGQSATFTVAAANGPFTCQWQSGPRGSGVFANLSDGGQILGSASPALSLTNVTQANSADFRVVVTEASGTSTSSVASLTITAAPYPTPGTIAILHAFTNSPDGATPVGAPVLTADGRVIGMTSSGGTHGDGIIYSVGLDGSGYSILHDFAGTPDGATPGGGLIEADGVLYGTTTNGGLYGFGMVFSLAEGTNLLTDLYDFTGGDDGANPVGELLFVADSPNNFLNNTGKVIGMSSSGGSKGYGVAYSVGTLGSGFTVLHTFSNSPDGATPVGGMVAVNSPNKTLTNTGKVIGMASSGGSKGYGVAFSMGTDGSGFTNIYNFTGGEDGGTPVGGIAESDNGKVIGMAASGGTRGDGVAFSMGVDGSGFNAIHTFTNSPDGGTPVGGITESDNGKVIGMAASGGTRGYGVLFAMAPDGSGATNLYDFSGGNDGGSPEGTPIYAAAGQKVIGMTSSGGSKGYGVVFAYTFTNSLMLSQVVSNGTLNLQWLPPAVLQASSNLLNWVDLSTATSPFTPPTSSIHQYFRLRQPQ